MKIDIELLSAKGDHFNELYFKIHKELMSYGKRQKSRNGDCIEFMDFKTELTNPIKRCVGGNNRNMNVFFLLAEALWIWAGRKDVDFLHNFNSVLKNYSDNGKVYHAPYGYRMRKFGASSFQQEFLDGNQVNNDQIATALRLLGKNQDDRRVVVQIWNAALDLGTDSKDIPCNDILMLKIRDGVLRITVDNRSNDLNLGLTTNIFQFSFVGEIMAAILGVEYGVQVHNSNSLHAYSDFEITKLLSGDIDEDFDLYKYANATPMDFNFVSEDVSSRLADVDFHVCSMISMLSKMSKGLPFDNTELDYFNVLKNFSTNFYFIFTLLSLYLRYKKGSETRSSAFEFLLTLREEEFGKEYGNSDYLLMAMNFFYVRMGKDEKQRYSELINDELQFLGTL